MINDSNDTRPQRQPKLSVSVTLELLHQLDMLVALHKPFAKRHAVHLAALKIGLVELTENPNRFLEAFGR